MRFATIVAALVPVIPAFATTFTVKVGENGTNTYNPTNINATVGDVISFQFLAKNHTVTQSSFAAPCANFTAANGTTGVDSGFQPVAANASAFPEFSFTLMNASAPLWFYCRQTGHCEQGMVFAINPTAAKSFDAFQANAKATANSTNATTSAAPSGASAAPSSTGMTTSTNGAGAVRLGGAAVLLTAVGAIAGVFL